MHRGGWKVENQVVVRASEALAQQSLIYLHWSGNVCDSTLSELAQISCRVRSELVWDSRYEPDDYVVDGESTFSVCKTAIRS